MTKTPPIPQDQRSDKGPGADPQMNAGDEIKQDPGAPGGAHPRNLEQQGQQGNSKQNTTHQGLQQDR
jgi:hypothetical protein